MSSNSTINVTKSSTTLTIFFKSSLAVERRSSVRVVRALHTLTSFHHGLQYGLSFRIFGLVFQELPQPCSRCNGERVVRTKNFLIDIKAALEQGLCFGWLPLRLTNIDL